MRCSSGSSRALSLRSGTLALQQTEMVTAVQLAILAAGPAIYSARMTMPTVRLIPQNCAVRRRIGFYVNSLSASSGTCTMSTSLVALRTTSAGTEPSS
jgi:hypothetical protein